MNRPHKTEQGFISRRSIKAFSFLFLLISVLTSCEKNDPLHSLGTVGDYSANIYFIPLSPIADAATDVVCEIEYWTEGDGTLSEELKEEVREIRSYEIEFADIDYTFEFDSDEVIKPEGAYATYNFDFTNWNPNKNAYVVRPKYGVPGDYKRISTSQSNTTREEFSSTFTDSLSMKFYDKYLSLLTEDVAYEMFVNKNEVATQIEFNSRVNNNGQVEEGEIAFFSDMLGKIAIEDLMASKYKYTNTKRIGVTYTITNTLNEYAESVTRYFNVK